MCFRRCILLSLLLVEVRASALRETSYLHHKHLGRAAPQQGLIAAYYPGYNAQLLPPESIPWQMYDHLDYFVATTAETPDADLVIEAEDNLKAVVSGARDHNVSISLTVGGWTGSKYFSSLVATDESRKKFAASIERAFKKYGFNGIDIDWEYPNAPGNDGNQVSKDDSANFLEFLKVLREVLGSSARLSAAVSVRGFAGPDGQYLTDLSAYGQVLDFITIMAYDIYGPNFSQVVGPNAPLFDTCNDPNNKFSVARAIKTWTDAGFPASRILLGIPAYGYQYTVPDSDLKPTNFSSQSNQSSLLFGPVSQTPATPSAANTPAGQGTCGGPQSGNQWLFKDLIACGKLSADVRSGLNGFTRYYDVCTHTPFLFNPDSKTLITYDDVNSLALKAKYAKAKGLAGVNIFDATGDTPEMALLNALSREK